MTSKNNLPQNNNHYWPNGAFCVNCGILKGDVINNNVHPIWHPACRPGCNSAWCDQEPFEYEETDEDRFYRELEEQEQEEWKQQQAEWEQERLQEEWEEEQGEIWEQEREEMDLEVFQEHHAQCCIAIIERGRAFAHAREQEYYPGAYLPEFNPHTDTNNYRLH